MGSQLVAVSILSDALSCQPVTHVMLKRFVWQIACLDTNDSMNHWSRASEEQSQLFFLYKCHLLHLAVLSGYKKTLSQEKSYA